MNWKFWNKSKGPKKKKTATREWVDAIVFAVIAATLIRTFFIEAYTIPTPSMERSLLVGDFLFVSKVNYGMRPRHTINTVRFDQQLVSFYIIVTITITIGKYIYPFLLGIQVF